MSESQNSKNKDDMFPVDPKTRENDYNNSSIELSGESVFIGCETGKPNRNTETNNLEKISNNVQSALADSAKSVPTNEKYSEQTSSEIMESINPDYRKNEDSKNTKENLELSKSGNAEHAAVEQEKNSEGYEIESKVNIVREINLYAHSFDSSEEDCLKVGNTWPDLHPYEKTEEIPVEELKSLELKGIFTKYLKLDLSNEFIVIKVTSGSNVLVNAVKYKESDSKHASSAEYKPTDNSVDNCDSKKANEDVAAVAATLISNDRGFQGENSFSSSYISLEEIDIKKEKSSSSEEILIGSFENSASGNDLHASETEVIKDVFTKIESAPQGGDFEGDYLKSIASEDEEVDCAPTRVRILNPIPALTKDTPNVSSLYSLKTSLIGRIFSKQTLGSDSSNK